MALVWLVRGSGASSPLTFWQVTLDLPSAAAVPSGHGHSYAGEHVNGWVTVLQPDGWTDEKTEQLRGIITGG